MSNLFTEKHIELIISGDRHSVAKHYKYLWGKYVTGFNGAEHCAKCLKGKWTNHLGLYPKLDTPLIFNECDGWDYLYVCGVDKRGYNYNLHAPLRFLENSVVEITAYSGVKFKFINAELLEIPELPDGFLNYDKSYTTCRNFRFGFFKYREHLLDKII